MSLPVCQGPRSLVGYCVHSAPYLLSFTLPDFALPFLFSVRVTAVINSYMLCFLIIYE